MNDVIRDQKINFGYFFPKIVAPGYSRNVADSGLSLHWIDIKNRLESLNSDQ